MMAGQLVPCHLCDPNSVQPKPNVGTGVMCQQVETFSLALKFQKILNNASKAHSDVE